MACSHCGAENRPEAKFCVECGSPLVSGCPRCGTVNAPGSRFCDECGTSLLASNLPPADPVPYRPTTSPAGPLTERRLVSVLFADLVGFTTLSEQRDAEDVRDILSRYFDVCRQVVERYGGSIEKFIGDAVMAVWGTPRVQEDDAERAVRTALELVAAVAALGQEMGTPDLRVRAGVVTGTAVVTLGAVGQGMVAGDLVNTASRVQAAAEPGTVLVSDRTRHATEAAISYAEPRTATLKGKAEPVTLWLAQRVIAGRRGALKVEGLEAPFVGRDRELRLVKDLFHASADGRRAHLVSVVGPAGIGKSRMAWEFFKYVDGLAESTLWHQGRCLAYGEGVAYWALAEMVRSRAGVLDGDDALTARQKLAATVVEFVQDPQERGWLESRLAHLLGIEDRAAAEREDLFAAWRRFLECLAETEPTILVFEDVQWADASLFEFIDHVLEWSRDHPLYVMMLARPEGSDAAGWATRTRSFTGLHLEPLPQSDMALLLNGLVPGLPAELRAQILQRAEGVPLYAVETVRMLLDGGMVEWVGDSYRVTSQVESLAVPESLQALLSARLDGLPSSQRRLLQHGAVLGKSFSARALAALAETDPHELDAALDALRRRQILTLHLDGRLPDQGRYTFVQDLLRHVTYQTLARPERKDYHLRAASYLERGGGPGEQEAAPEVIGSHYLQAFEAATAAEDADVIKGKARDMLARAGERAAALAASEEAHRYFAQAASLADDSIVAASMSERSGQMAWAAGHTGVARGDYELALAAFDSAGYRHRAARVAARLAEISWAEGRIEEAVAQAEAAFGVLADDEPDQDLAELAAELGRFLFFTGSTDRALDQCERALEMAESLRLPAVLSQAVNTKAIALTMSKKRPEEGAALLRLALSTALDSDVPSAAVRAYYNSANLAYYRDQLADSVRYAEEGLTLARRLGDRSWEWNFLAQLAATLSMTGDWEEALQHGDQIPFRDQITARFAGVELLLGLSAVHLGRGEVDEAEAVVNAFQSFHGSADRQERATFAAASAGVQRARGDVVAGLALAREACESRHAFGGIFGAFKVGFVEAQECALALGDLTSVEELQTVAAGLSGGEATPYVDAHAARFGARLAALRDDLAGVEQGYQRAAGLFREMDAPFWLAVTLVERQQLSIDPDSAQVVEAEEIFTRLGAKPWLDRIR